MEMMLIVYYLSVLAELIKGLLQMIIKGLTRSYKDEDDGDDDDDCLLPIRQSGTDQAWRVIITWVPGCSDQSGRLVYISLTSYHPYTFV